MQSEEKTSEMNDETRNELIKKLDQDMDEYIEKMKKESADKLARGETSDAELSVEELMQHPAFLKEIDYSKPLSPELQGLISLRYEDNDDIRDKAEAYKEDGNHNFKYKKYRFAVANYTEAIKCGCPDKNFNAILYANRAAAHFHLGNYRSAFNDCVISRKFKPDHMKAIVRGAHCCLNMKRFEDAMKWCDSGLLVEQTNAKLLEMRAEAEQKKKSQDRDKRKAEMKERKEAEKEQKLISAIKSRGVTIYRSSKKGDISLSLSDLESHHPAGVKVNLDASGVLHWPVLFLYPEYGETDFLQSVSENSRLCDHIEHMFGSDTEPPSWDLEKKYTPARIQVYFEEKEKECLHKVDTSDTLAGILKDKRYVVQAGTPSFILLAAESEFETHFLTKYGYRK
ncbi:tetratricopeptide repeat protein 4 [Lingula anatina]|uniref:Tetratricopeptide repeat protein 4 n=1 Tax=Lingula anatina TaxID=7574 RepID=A0A1S3JGY2_LINAN|nr:tetratricopeptide repeat protein 4 [Lingula anatina]|eukprot:XP_013409657.1 tetratricopeptide repeat protein 4 [Lingula anatina]